MERVIFRKALPRKPLWRLQWKDNQKIEVIFKTAPKIRRKVYGIL